MATAHLHEWRERLYLPAYTVVDAARYAATRPSTITRWHHGTGRREPALPGKSKGEALSYLQLVEVAFVATFRSVGVTLQRIRNAREFLRDKLGSEYPFATYQFYTEGKHVLVKLARELPEVQSFMKADERGQIAWNNLLGDRFAQFEYEGGFTVRWRPTGSQSPVAIDPRIAFGAPSVRGVPTWELRGRLHAGEGIDDIADDFNLSPLEVRKALEFEGVAA